MGLKENIADELVSAVPVDSICFRNVKVRRATKTGVLATTGSIVTGGRYNFIGDFGTLYLSWDIHTSIEETTKSNISLLVDIAMRLPVVIVGYEVILSKVLDLTDISLLNRIGIVKGDLLEDWENSQMLGVPALTQDIGRYAYDVGFEAIRSPSAVWGIGMNLNIFPDKLLAGSRIEAVNREELPD